MSNEKQIAKIGDYVTTNSDATYEVMTDCYGVLFFQKIGVRQGILTGKKYSKFDTELSGISIEMYQIQGEAGTYAVPDIGLFDLCVVPDNNLFPHTLKFAEKIRNNSFHYGIAKLLEKAYKEGYLSGASTYIGELDSDEDMRIAQSQSWESRSSEFLTKILDIQRDLLK